MARRCVGEHAVSTTRGTRQLQRAERSAGTARVRLAAPGQPCLGDPQTSCHEQGRRGQGPPGFLQRTSLLCVPEDAHRLSVRSEEAQAAAPG